MSSTNINSTENRRILRRFRAVYGIMGWANVRWPREFAIRFDGIFSTHSVEASERLDLDLVTFS